MSKYICLLFFLFGCTPTTQKVQAELNGTYSWGNVFVAEEIKILDENFEFEAFSDCIGCGEIVDYPLKGRLNLEGETIIFDENKQYLSLIHI